MMHHSAVSLDMIRQHPDCIVALDEFGLVIPRKHIRRMVSDFIKAGFAYWPPCDNVGPDGRCAGHEEGQT